MDKFWVVTLFNLQLGPKERAFLEEAAVEKYQAQGIEEFSLSEAEVDAILGERSYSGGDLPMSVLEEVEEKVLARPTHYRFYFYTESDAENFHGDMKQKFLCEVQLEEQRQEDWNAEWKKHYAPIKVNSKLEILPSWQKDRASTSEFQIYIYPGMGFGTGSHETTFLCLKLFTENLLGKSVKKALDFGSGSGILGLSTFLFFPHAQIDFFDIDPEANKNCHENAVLNGLEDRSYRLLLPEYKDKLQDDYDLIYANILESILLQEKEFLVQRLLPGGHMVLSGLLNHQAGPVISAYEKAGLVTLEVAQKGDWSAVLLERPKK